MRIIALLPGRLAAGRDDFLEGVDHPSGQAPPVEEPAFPQALTRLLEFRLLPEHASLPGH